MSNQSDTPLADKLSTFLVTQFPATLGNVQLNQLLLEVEAKERELIEQAKATVEMCEQAEKYDQLHKQGLDKIESLRRELNEAKDALDMNVDEFTRIKVLAHGINCAEADEIIGLCDRAKWKTKQTVPLIEQRDAAIKDRDALAAQLQIAKNILHAQTLALRELGHDDQDAVAVIGEPVHSAIRERDALAAKLDFLKSKGMTVWVMKTSDKPEPYLVYVVEPDSELDNTPLVRKLVDAELKLEKAMKCVEACKAIDCRLRPLAVDDALRELEESK